MKNAVITFCLLVGSIMFNSCFNKIEGINDKVGSQIKPKMIIELAETFKIDVKENKNIHIFYNEILNDSTWLVTIRQNGILGSEEFGLCEFYTLKDVNIFVYGGNLCRIELNDSLKCKSDEWPIEFDGIHFNLLVAERNKKMIYYRLVRDFKFDEGEPDSNELNLMDIE